MSNNLALPLCPKCGDTRYVKRYTGHEKLATVYVCLRCGIYWSTDLGIQDLPEGWEKYAQEIRKD